ncbi:unnamed protein product [Onchocerca flexuosa]|uniref:Uncharacterized protein n=1 Tax=Onchocerca flexuosa TaxID=387005 RepID=A0A183I716_9BILA|nr:unnamed protein product [Onchocerca flexuosa]
MFGFILYLGNTLVIFYFSLFFLHFTIYHWPWLDLFFLIANYFFQSFILIFPFLTIPLYHSTFPHFN